MTMPSTTLRAPLPNPVGGGASIVSSSGAISTTWVA